ncbi:Splicing factor U2AF 23 kDa subunit [Tritrichomonas foetus]|uniref:Splicing factor U2AF 23 kDa subunit n=1 Tax=Tritrichomonas foetus TaxID=1144522 RepID=A0A1J4JQ52_9EUKA|nr:Splicing factor U2AF 23 kDa subunit [Tritrichomonas foetus]|eukprot:OHT01179.1 Splicing factor U2AF 23 kDa subunit [Tritrichomonas foetus]
MNNINKLDPEKTICNYFDRTGCCAKEDLCNKTHRNAELSRCLVFHHIFPDPDLFVESLPDPDSIQITKEEKINLINSFYLDMVIMLKQFGPLEDLVVASNRSDTMSGNVVAMFREVDGAASAYLALNGQFYAGRKIRVTFAPIIRLASAICRGYEDGECKLGNTCSFIHPHAPSPWITDECFPRAQRMFAAPFRISKRTRILDTPQEVLYGKSKMISEEFKKYQ